MTCSSEVIFDGLISDWVSTARPERTSEEVQRSLRTLWKNEQPKDGPWRVYIIDDKGRTEFTYRHEIKTSHSRR